MLPPAVTRRNVVSLAVDGSTTADVTARQLPRLSGASHIIISTGGNDALQARHAVVTAAVGTMAEALLRLAAMQAAFEAKLVALLDGVAAAAPGVPVMLLVPYYPNLPAGPELTLSKAGLSFYADVAYRAAAARSITVLDLRLIFTSEADYANAIEPSAEGGLKIARRIIDFVASHLPAWAAHAAAEVGGGGGSGGGSGSGSGESSVWGDAATPLAEVVCDSSAAAPSWASHPPGCLCGVASGGGGGGGGEHTPPAFAARTAEATVATAVAAAAADLAAMCGVAEVADAGEARPSLAAGLRWCCALARLADALPPPPPS